MPGWAWIRLAREFRLYYQHWYRLLDELRAQFPQVFFEACASGGMRLDAGSLAHSDGHFLSDNVNPLDALRIFQGALLRVPPGLLANGWFCGRAVRRYRGPRPLPKALLNTL